MSKQLNLNAVELSQFAARFSLQPLSPAAVAHEKAVCAKPFAKSSVPLPQ